jgi:amidohydrolase
MSIPELATVSEVLIDSKTAPSNADANVLLQNLRARLPEFEAIRREIHKHPETAFEEVRTAALVQEKLASYGLEVATGLGVTGVVGTLRAGTSNCAIGLRADMDALNMEELNKFGHRSIHPGKMHACGHDGHTATLLAAAAHLAESRSFDGTVYFIFQPAEEAEGGAPRMIADGLFERFPMQAVFGMHNLPGMPLGSFAVKPGAMMAGVVQFDIVIKGQGGHAAMHHLAHDPIVAAGAIIQALQTIVSRNKNPVSSAVLSVTRIQGGSAHNVIPDEVELSGTVRYFDTDVEKMIAQRMEEIVTLVARAHGCSGTLNYQRLYPATINSSNEAAVCSSVLCDLVGTEHVDTNWTPLMAGEDFAFMLLEKPGCYIIAGNGDGTGGCSVHNPNYDFNDQLIPYGAAYWVRLVEASLPVA